jgi:tagatose 6-phosphate kinase
MSDDVITTITLNAVLHVSYSAAGPVAAGAVSGGTSSRGRGSGDVGSGDGGSGDRAGGDTAIVPVSHPRYRAGGRGITAARVLSAFGHDVLAAGLVGGAAGELIREDLARSAVPTAFTQIRAESRRIFEFEVDGPLRFGEPGPYITTEELGRFAADYRKLLSSAAAVVLCGSLPESLPPDMYASLVRYATEAGVPVILDAGGEELVLAVRNRPALVVAESREADAGHSLLRLGAAAVAVVVGQTVRVVTSAGEWTAELGKPASAAASLQATSPQATSLQAISPQAASAQAASAQAASPQARPSGGLDRGALVAGLVPGELLGWSWPDRLRHSLALAAAAASGDVDSAVYEELLDNVTVSAL